MAKRVAPDDALERVREAVGEKVSDPGINYGQIDLTVQPEDVVEVVRALRDTEGIETNFFTFMSGVDRTEFADAPGGLEVLLHLYSPDNILHVNLHVPVDLDEPRCPTLTDLFKGAFWHERETFEMFGIEFEGHPRLVNLYLPEDFEGHPLRKSFRLPGRQVKEWPGAKDPEEAAAGGR